MLPKSFLPLTLILATSLLTGCATPANDVPTEPAIDLAAEEQEIRDLSAQWMAAVQARNLPGIMEMFTADAIMNFDGTFQQGLDEIQASEEANWAAFPDAILTWTPITVVVAAAGDMAYEQGTWTYDPDGQGATEAIGDYVSVWTKVDDEWKVAIDAGSVRQATAADGDMNADASGS